jgi:catechol 2,3-dioxygenase-like lactoylglutathione lyase family enzyme
MGFHHVAVTTRDLKATHEFYTGPMGFSLAKVIVGPTGTAGWARHVFYDTGDGRLMAFWDLHDDDLPPDHPTAISIGLGLPIWANHIAFDATDRADLDARRCRLLEHGLDVMEIDHGWCHSIYVVDPNGILVEFCTSTRVLGDADREAAERLLRATAPEVEPAAVPIIHRASEYGRG